MRILRVLIVLGVVAGAVSLAIPVAVAAAASAVYNTLTSNLPDPSKLQKVEQDFQTTRILDRTGKLLYEVLDESAGDRQWVKYDDISPFLRCAVVASEDRRFYETEGVDIRGLARAVLNNLQGGVTQGASGISQQLVKNAITPIEERVGPKRTTEVKIRETLISIEVNRRYDKKTQLEWYLNTNFYGNLAYGIEAASQVYFGKSARDLTLAEAAMLAPIPQFPALNPFDNPEDAKERQGLALQAMVEAGEITQAEADAAFAEELNLSASVAERFDVLTAPHFALYVLEQIKNRYNTTEDPFYIWRKGLTVYTTLDVELQKYAEQVAREQVAVMEEQGKNADNASVVAIKNDTGEILAMVGSLDYNNRAIDGQVNIAISERQPGSSFKPYVYLTALQQGMTPATMILDVDTAFPQADGSYYRPENYDRQYHGPVSLRNALAR